MSAPARVLTPAEFAGGAARPGPVVACIGDSITRGRGSADWIRVLAEADTSRTYINAGIDGNFAWNVAERLDSILQCEPDVVTLLIGTNDVVASESDQVAANYRRRKDGEPPTLNTYLRDVDAILRRLRDGSSRKVALIEIPPLGEDLDSPLNARVSEYNDALNMLAKEHHAEMLPLNARLSALLPEDHHPTFNLSLRGILMAIFKHSVLRRSWDQIAASNGLLLLTDHIHLNDRAGGVLAQLVAGFIASTDRQLPTDSRRP